MTFWILYKVTFKIKRKQLNAIFRPMGFQTSFYHVIDFQISPVSHILNKNTENIYSNLDILFKLIHSKANQKNWEKNRLQVISFFTFLFCILVPKKKNP